MPCPHGKKFGDCYLCESGSWEKQRAAREASEQAHRQRAFEQLENLSEAAKQWSPRRIRQEIQNREVRRRELELWITKKSREYELAGWRNADAGWDQAANREIVQLESEIRELTRSL